MCHESPCSKRRNQRAEHVVLVENARTQGVHLDHNLSDRFESRFVTVKISKSPSIMLLGMEESVLGIWLAHGEGNHSFHKSTTSSSDSAEFWVCDFCLNP